MALFFYKEKNKDIRAAAYLRLSIEDGDKAESNTLIVERISIFSTMRVFHSAGM